jgi:hypothetical protein
MNNANVFFISPVKPFGFKNATAAATSSPVRSGGGASASPTGAIATAAASIINNTVDNLFQNKVYKSQAELLKAQAEAQEMKTRLMLLNATQQGILATQLQEMNDDNAKAKLLNDMVVAITTAQLNASQYNVNEIYIAGLTSTGTNNSSNVDLSKVTASAANNQIKLALILLGATVIVVAAAVVIKKNS